MSVKWLLTGLIIVLLALQYRLRVGEGSLAHRASLKQQIKEQMAENAELKERNKKLALEVEALKSGLEGVEERARQEMGMIKKGETFFMVIDPDANSPKPLSSSQTNNDD